MVELTKKQRQALRSVAWGTKHFGSLMTGRETSRRTVLALVKRGLCESVGMVAMCDGDGFLVQPERYREGFAITKAGKKLLRQIDREDIHG